MAKNLTRNQKSKRMVIYWLVGFFGVIFIMNAFMITKATQTFNGVVAKKSYQQGINYNQVLANEKQIANEGLQQDLKLTLSENNTLDIELVLKHKNPSYDKPENVVLTFWRPTNEGQDFQLNLLAKNNYKMRIIFRPEQIGVWNIKYNLATLDNKLVAFNKRIILE